MFVVIRIYTPSWGKLYVLRPSARSTEPRRPFVQNLASEQTPINGQQTCAVLQSVGESCKADFLNVHERRIFSSGLRFVVGLALNLKRIATCCDSTKTRFEFQNKLAYVYTHSHTQVTGYLL